MDQLTLTFITYFGFAAAMGVLSNFMKPTWTWLASSAVVVSSFLLALFAGPLMIFALFYAVPCAIGRFSYRLIHYATEPAPKEITA